jgi:DNA-binding IclR family transcriptional regulator
MTPAEEAHFIALWQAGTETAAIAQQLGIPRGTVGSRAYALVRQGKIQPRPKGGNYPMQRRQRR